MQHDCEEVNGEETVADSEEVQGAKRLEMEAVKVAEQGRMEDALTLLTQAMALAPHYPSPYNNRAQVHSQTPQQTLKDPYCADTFSISQ